MPLRPLRGLHLPCSVAFSVRPGVAQVGPRSGRRPVTPRSGCDEVVTTLAAPLSPRRPQAVRERAQERTALAAVALDALFRAADRPEEPDLAGAVAQVRAGVNEVTPIGPRPASRGISHPRPDRVKDECSLSSVARSPIRCRPGGGSKWRSWALLDDPQGFPGDGPRAPGGALGRSWVACGALGRPWNTNRSFSWRPYPTPEARMR